MILVTCAIILKDGKILATQRGTGRKQPFKWEFPGGKLEAGELPHYCIAREIREELQIEIKIKERLKDAAYDYGDFQICLLPFVADYVSGNITLTEHMNFKWLHPSELRSLDWAAADVPVVEDFLESLHR